MPKSCTNGFEDLGREDLGVSHIFSRPQVQMVRLQPESRVFVDRDPCGASEGSPGTVQSTAWMFDGRGCSRGKGRKGTNGFGRRWPNYVKQSCLNNAAKSPCKDGVANGCRMLQAGQK